MALDPLATTADLTARGIATDQSAQVSAMLAAASESVREAAGCPISSVTTTAWATGGRGSWLDLPGPITDIDSVEVNGVAVTGWKVRRGRAWRSQGWWPGYGNDFTVTYTFGLPEVPADIVDLVCSLVAAGLSAIEDGYDPGRGLSSIGIDDYRESYTRGDDEIVNPMELPERTRIRLQQRFGGGTYVTGSYE